MSIIPTRLDIRHQNAFSGEYVFELIPILADDTILTPATFSAWEGALRAAFTLMLDQVRNEQLLINSSRMQVIVTDGNISAYTLWVLHHNITVDLILEVLMRKVNSKEAMELDKAIVYIRYGRGRQGGGYFDQAISFKEFCQRKKFILVVPDSADNCFFYCLSYALDRNFTDRYRGDYRGPMSLSDIPQFEERHNLNILVVDYKSRRWAYLGCGLFERSIYLVYDGDETNRVGHFNYFKDPSKLGTLWNERRYCFECMTAYRNTKHKCIKTCYACESVSCSGVGHPNNEFTIVCYKCNRKFFDQQCIANHRAQVCKKQKRCRVCSVFYQVRPNRPHECYKVWCKFCKMNVPMNPPHQCYHTPLTETQLEEPSRLYIFYDYECYFKGNEHQVAGVIAMYMDSDTVYRFESNHEFIEWLFHPRHKGYTAIAHNSGRYDFHMIKREMIKRGIQSDDIVNGNSIRYCHAKKFKIRFVDSYAFIPSSLRAFSKTFGLTEVSKGYFPYRFFTEERRHYEGVLPPIEEFEFGSLKPSERQNALKWYEEHQGERINLYNMCMDYCVDDVKLLKAGCCAFRKLFMDITDNEVDPFQYITIASVCHKIFKRFFLPTNTIAILNTSLSNIERYEWLAWLGRDRTLQYNVDGCDAFDGTTYYHYIGCADNGCEKCYKPKTAHPIDQQPMYFKRAEYRDVRAQQPENLVEMRGCEWRFKRHMNQEISSFVETLEDPRRPMNIRDAFFGGRTEPFKLYCKDESIAYYDYTSLYPCINFGRARGITKQTQNQWYEFPYPIGHPVYLKENIGSLDQYFGFAKCKVIPPQDLYIPLLPSRRNGKLFFDNREKIGTWTTVELLKAQELGYVIAEVYEVCHFPSQSNTLFTEYVRTFLKIKQQAAGWDKLGCHTDEEKAHYIDQYREVMGIELDPSAIQEYNPGLYFIAKLCLNSLWGKFGQRNSFSQHQVVFDQNEFEKYAHNDHYDVLNVYFHDPRTRTITYKKRTEFLGKSATTNIAIAAFTTAYARLRLYDAMEAVGRDVLYCDTDSVIFRNRGQLVTGPFLGDLTNELDEEDRIVEFVSTGPKSYGYRTMAGEVCCKIKGFTLNIETSRLLNFDSLKYMVTEDQQHQIITRPLQFVINQDHGIETKKWGEGEGKKFTLTFDKRKISLCNESNVLDTVPF
jgi:hypothetical protein